METNILEINLISAQGLKPPSGNIRRLQTYAIAWVNPAAKLKTRVDTLGGENPTWNDKFLFRVSKEFVSGDTSAVSVEILGVGYIKGFLIGTVRFLLSTCLKIINPVRGGGTPAFTAVQIRRPSGRFQGVLNIAAAVYDSSAFGMMDKVSAVSFRDLMDMKESESRRRRRLSRVGSKQSSGGESCDSSDSSTSTALKDCNSGSQSNGRGFLCGLMMQRKIPFCPSDRDLESWADSYEENEVP